MRGITGNEGLSTAAGDAAAMEADATNVAAVLAAMYGSPGAPPERDWAELGERVAAPSRSRGARVGAGILVGGAALVLSAAGYAAISSNNLADRMFANFGSAPEAEGTHRFGLSQSVDGVTVTVDHVVVGSERVRELVGSAAVHEEYVPLMLQITVDGGAGSTSHFVVSDTLRAGETPLRRIGGVGLRGSSELLGRELPPGQDQLLFAYDATALPLEQEIALTLDLEVQQLAEAGGESASRTARVPAQRDRTPRRFSFELRIPSR